MNIEEIANRMKVNGTKIDIKEIKWNEEKQKITINKKIRNLVADFSGIDNLFFNLPNESLIIVNDNCDISVGTGSIVKANNNNKIFGDSCCNISVFDNNKITIGYNSYIDCQSDNKIDISSDSFLFCDHNNKIKASVGTVLRIGKDNFIKHGEECVIIQNTHALDTTDTKYNNVLVKK